MRSERGDLIFGEQRVDDVDVSIDGTISGDRARQYRGRLGAPRDVIFRAWRTGGARLRMTSGATIDIIITDATSGTFIGQEADRRDAAPPD
ncbi:MULTISPECIES: hypothetical protein [unclassified Chelatococcus]|uniref:hypothetical protein n=1 Tax=unclassified Chelatococcus TaxID=2638111 RepID=UPI0002D44AC8|nr:MULTISPECIES: hypothetical protein [unclassified Chelatococcus]